MDRCWQGSAFPVSRQRLYFWVLLLGFTNVVVDRAARSVATLGWATSISDLFQVSAIVLAGMAGSLILLRDSPQTAAATRIDLAVALLVALCALPPVGLLSRAAVAFAAFYLLWSSPRWSGEWRAAAIAASTSAYFIVGPALLAMFSRELTFMDAWLVAQVTGLEQRGDVVAMSGDAGWLKVFAACSSIHAVSLAIILPVTYSCWFAIESWRTIAAVFVSTAAATMAINVARLSAMAEWPSYFDMLHEGWGASAIAAMTLLVMIAICYGGFERARA